MRRRPPNPPLFPYTTLFRSRAPDRAPVLEACYAAAIRTVRDRVESARRALFIGGKSMGGRIATGKPRSAARSEEHTSELQSRFDLVCRLLLEKKKRSL